VIFALAGLAEAPPGAVLLLTLLGMLFLPFALISAGGWTLCGGIVLLGVDVFLASHSGGVVIRWQRQHHVPEAFIGFGAITAALLTCTLLHGLLLVGPLTFQ
jgi:hypothetical protein